LRSLGRGHLNRLLTRYQKELDDAGIVIAQPEKDADFYRELAAVFMRPEGIPPALHEALFHIEGLDTKGGFERIVDAVLVTIEVPNRAKYTQDKDGVRVLVGIIEAAKHLFGK
jgi:hypothetical protein